MNRLAVLLLVLALLPSASAAVNVQVPGGYVSTAPLVLDDMVVVRSSATFDGRSSPAVVAYIVGVESWRVVGPPTVQPDMADLVHAPAGAAACGAWPDTLLVAWSSGRLDALRLDGTSLWSVETEVDGWGLTATPVLTPSFLVQVTRHGIEHRCLADGSLLARAEIGVGWRNPATVLNGTSYVGDETGRLWTWHGGEEQATSIPITGRLRHAPVPVAGGLLLHTQEDAGSVVAWHPLTSNGTPSNASPAHRLLGGAAPGMPLGLGQDTAIIADSTGLLHMTWTPEGWRTEEVDSRPVNGPLRSEEGLLLASENGPTGGFVVLDLDGWRAHEVAGPRGYGTAPPVVCGSGLLLVKDDGRMVVVDDHRSTCPLASLTPQVDRSPAVWSLSLLVAYLVGAVAWKRRGALHGAKWASPFLLVALVLVLPQIGVWWATLGPAADPEDVWDPSWPASWEGGQVVAFELPSGQVAIGGLSEAETVLDATMAAAAATGLTLTVEQHSLGPWVTAVEGVEGQGWVVEVDGLLLGVGAAQGALEPEAVVVWRLA